jgi:hypothetical protein
MKCPNCSAECPDQALECEFCGHPFIGDLEIPVSSSPSPLAPTEQANHSGRATYTASEPTYLPPDSSYRPPAPSENPYDASYPSASRSSRKSGVSDSVPNHLVWAILATLCCCVPTGIAAIVYAAQVDGKLAGGDYHGAVESSNNAKMWSLISLGLGAVVGVLYVMAGVGGRVH